MTHPLRLLLVLHQFQVWPNHLVDLLHLYLARTALEATATLAIAEGHRVLEHRSLVVCWPVVYRNYGKQVELE